MSYRSSSCAFAIAATAIAAAVVAAALAITTGAGRAADGAKYPDWGGQWDTVTPRLGGQSVKYDPYKAFGVAQEAPLTPEYKKIHEESMADQANGGEGNFFDHAVRCMPGGMPIMTIGFGATEFIVTPETTYISGGGGEPLRRIFTDGRDWPPDNDKVEPTYGGYSIGRWIDEDGDGRYDVLEAETRGPFKGPRSYDATGLPLHFDNQSIFKERIFRDKDNPKLLHDVLTTIDHALTRPWTVDKRYTLNPNPRFRFGEVSCAENMRNSMIAIGRESYYMSAEGLLMPVRKDQPPPDLRYFKRIQK